MNMQPLLLTLLIGTAFAMVNAAPAQNKQQNLQAVLEGDGERAKAQLFGSLIRRVAKHLLGKIFGTSKNEMKLAKLQEGDKAKTPYSYL